MEVIITDSAGSASQEEAEQKTAQVLDQIENIAPPEKVSQITALAIEIKTHTPISYFVNLAPEQGARWILDIFSFLESRGEDVAIHMTEPGKGGHCYLLTNTPDAPFLVDSLQAYLHRHNVRFQVVSHPILQIRRQRGAIAEIAGPLAKGPHESFILVELQGITEKIRSAITSDLNRILSAVLTVERNRPKMAKKLKSLEEVAGPAAYRDFWRWLEGGNFLPFAFRSYLLRRDASGNLTVTQEDSGLGISHGLPEMAAGESRPLENCDAAFADRLRRERAMVAEELQRISPVHRSDHLTYLGWKEQVEADTWREHAFVGLFSQHFLEVPTFSIAPLRRKIEAALQTLGIPKGCHDYNKTIDIFNTFPKVELFFMRERELLQAVRSFTFLYRQGAVKVVVTSSLSVHGLILLIILPREFYSSDKLERFENYICRYFRVDAATSRIMHISADYISLHISLRPADDPVRIDRDRLEHGLTEIAQPWELKLRILLEGRLGEMPGEDLYRKYASGFSAEYRALTHPRFALRDIQGMEQVLEGGEDVFNLWGPFRGKDGEFYRLQFYSLRETYLNELMPFLENLNLCVIDELDFAIEVGDRDLYIKSFAIKAECEEDRPLSELRDNLLEILTALRQKRVENDNLNRLLIPTGLSWKEIDVFRGYRNYHHQIGSPFTKRRVAFALVHNPRAAELLFRYFEARFRPAPEWADPMQREIEALSPLRLELARVLEDVSDINEDRILRTFFNFIDSTVRTNFFTRRDAKKYFFSFKISSMGIIDMPVPRPLFEVYVHSADMEGIHLRGGKVARGGIRWSDRPDDFRTEVLGLMKTQMTKNALIVPVGSKGGFVVSVPFKTREEGAILSKRAYKTLMRGLLDLTDNRVGGKLVRPEGLIVYDEADPYLVVAADKGTAHLPDTANAVSEEYDFWLGDAFASGGSHGYDHKALGITARGAWECVKRHFREMGTDIQSEPFTVAAVGDMSGDVFGNGMLLSRQIRLVAAFNHRHIFLDPDPDPAASWQERKRLFELPRSTWDDYDRSLISKGGGIFERSAKEIELTPEVRRMLGTRHKALDAQELIRLILQAEVDLLWNGGIGTYVKDVEETHEEVGDRANDGVRIDAQQLRAKVVGEGGNLGMTQLARIAYALGGGRLNTDAVDNSAGVDCSDHEVNLKIFMQMLAEKGEVKGREERDGILQDVTDEVCEDVLANNYGQSLCISLDSERCAENIEPFLQLAHRLENASLLDRRSEALPEDEEMMARPGKIMTRPELSILMAYSKMQLYQALLESDLPGQAAVADCLQAYFPQGILDRFGELIHKHPLAREITATVITNRIIDQSGSATVSRLATLTGRTLVDCARAYLTFDRVIEGPELRRRVYALDNKMSAQSQHQILHSLENALESLCHWVLESRSALKPDNETILHYRRRMDAYIETLGEILPAQQWEDCSRQADTLAQAGLPQKQSARVAQLCYLRDFLPLTALTDVTKSDIRSVALAFNQLSSSLELEELLSRLDQVQVRDRWDRMAQDSLRRGFRQTLFEMTRSVMQHAEGKVETYFSRRRPQAKSFRNLREKLKKETPANFSPFSVLLQELKNLVE